VINVSKQISGAQNKSIQNHNININRCNSLYFDEFTMLIIIYLVGINQQKPECISLLRKLVIYIFLRQNTFQLF